MTHNEIVEMLEETNLPIAYDHFAEGESPDPPFICFLFPGSDNFSADGMVYLKIRNVKRTQSLPQATGYQPSLSSHLTSR